MRKYILLFLCFLSGFSLMAQEEAKPKAAVHHEIGVNATTFITTLLNFGNGPVIGAPYQLTYKLYGDTRWALRTGFGIQYSRGEQTISGITSDIFQSNIAGRLGFERQFPVGKRWQLNAGMDFKYDYYLNETTNNFNSTVTIKDKIEAFGLGPVLGFQFNITDRVFVSTETGIDVLFQKQTFTEEFNQFSEFSDEIITNTTIVDGTLPVSVFFSFKF